MNCIELIKYSYIWNSCSIRAAVLQIMTNKERLVREIIYDLQLNAPIQKGKELPIRNCWHFSTDGESIDVMFYDERDFTEGMNRIPKVLNDYQIIILAFCLMDNHVHFILYGEFAECDRFVREFVRRTSYSLSIRHGDRGKFAGGKINYQPVETDKYLKNAICYVINNPYHAGMNWMAYDYPWSSGPLYFRRSGSWASPSFDGMSGKIVFPGDYVDVRTVERIYRTPRAFSYFLYKNSKEDVESRTAMLSRLSIPDSEMRQHKNELCQSLFGVNSIKALDIAQRVTLAKELRYEYGSSVKQLARICGLKYAELEAILK